MAVGLLFNCIIYIVLGRPAGRSKFTGCLPFWVERARQAQDWRLWSHTGPEPGHGQRPPGCRTVTFIKGLRWVPSPVPRPILMISSNLLSFCDFVAKVAIV